MFVWTGNYNAYFSTDGGENWSPFYLSFYNQRIDEMVHNTSYPDTLFAISGDSLFRSTDRGSSWEIRSIGLSLQNLTIDPNHDNILYANIYVPNNSGIYKSRNAGIDWFLSDTVLSQRILVNSQNSVYLYSATGSHGIRRSTDSGIHWSNHNPGLPNFTVFSIDQSLDDPEQLYASTYGTGIYRLNEILSTIDDQKHRTVNSYMLFQNFPNPFNPVTHIAFDLPKTSRVNLKIYNILGEEIATVVSGSLAAGSYQYDWNASDYPSGLYFYHLEADHFTDIRKMLLVK
jgi:hypothetical protein